MLSILATPWGRLAGAVLLGGLLAGGIYGYGYWQASEAAKIEKLKADNEAFRNRSDVDAKIKNLDDIALCVHLGGALTDCERVRGLDESAKPK